MSSFKFAETIEDVVASPAGEKLSQFAQEALSGKSVAEIFRFPAGAHALHTDGTWASVRTYGEVWLRDPDGKGTSFSVHGVQAIVHPNGDFESFWQTPSIRSPACKDMQPAGPVELPELSENQKIIAPFSDPGSAINMLKDGSLVVHRAFGSSSLRPLFGGGLSPLGRLAHTTVLDQGSGVETTYFSGGSVLQVGPNRSSLLYGRAGGLSGSLSYDYDTNKLQATTKGLTEDKWPNGLKMTEFGVGRVHFSSNIDDSLDLQFDSQGRWDPLKSDKLFSLESGLAVESDRPRFREILSPSPDNFASRTRLRNGLIVEDGSDHVVNVYGRNGGVVLSVGSDGKILVKSGN